MLQSLCILCSILISTRHHDFEGWNSNGGAPAMQSYGGGGSGGMQHQVMDCAKAFVGSWSLRLDYLISQKSPL